MKYMIWSNQSNTCSCTLFIGDPPIKTLWWGFLNTRSLRNKNVALSCLFTCSMRTSEWHATEMTNLTYPLMRSLPKVVFTAAFLKYPLPVVVCLRCLSAAFELCSSVLPPNLVKRELVNTTTLSLDFLTSLIRLNFVMSSRWTTSPNHCSQLTMNAIYHHGKLAACKVLEHFVGTTPVDVSRDWSSYQNESLALLRSHLLHLIASQ